MHQSFVAPAPSGPRNSGAFNFSIFKALLKALHCRAKFVVYIYILFISSLSEIIGYVYGEQQNIDIKQHANIDMIHANIVMIRNMI